MKFFCFFGTVEETVQKFRRVSTPLDRVLKSVILAYVVLKERQKTILDAAIQGYIKTAKPIASRELCKEYGIRFSPATVRNEMNALDEMGYLEQPYTSAGRIPTNRGYRFFVDNCMREAVLQDQEKRDLYDLTLVKHKEEFIKEFLKTVVRIADTFTAVGVENGDMWYENGFSRLLEEPEFHDPENIRMFSYVADHLEELMQSIFEDIERSEIHLFIGDENPLLEIRRYAMFVLPWRHPRGFSGFLTLIGPTRTNYAKHTALARCILEWPR